MDLDGCFNYAAQAARLLGRHQLHSNVNPAGVCAYTCAFGHLN